MNIDAYNFITIVHIGVEVIITIEIPRNGTNIVIYKFSSSWFTDIFLGNVILMVLVIVLWICRCS